MNEEPIAYPPPQESVEQILIHRYQQRLKVVYQVPSPYYPYPSWEKSEIEQTIKKLLHISKKGLS